VSRYRKQQSPGDNLRDLYSKFQQWISSALGDSSIDWDDTGDDQSSLDLTVSDVTVAKYGHDGTRHGFLVPVTGGWVTVQEDAQTKATAAEDAAKAYTDTKDAATRTYVDGKVTALEGSIGDMAGLYQDLADRVSTLEQWRIQHTLLG
jgi:outer membrane protein TolC